MAQEFIIGRYAQSPVKVPADKLAVSGEHVKISIDDHGQWFIEDLGSSNGTYVRDSNGDFQQVFKKHISEDTVIRLGAAGHNSFTFMAHRVIAPESNYAYEFQILARLLKQQSEEEELLEEKNARKMNIVKTAPLLAMGICFILQAAIPDMDATTNLNLNRISMGAAAPLMGFIFGADNRGRKRLKQKRQKMLTCPKCGLPISEFDISNRQCSRCKAK